MADGVAPVPFPVEKVLPHTAASPNPPPNMDSKPTTAPSIPVSAPTEPVKPVSSLPPSSAHGGAGQQTQHGLNNSATPPVSGFGPDGAGPAVSYPAPRPVEVTSVPDTPVNGSTPAGQSPRPELNIPTEDAVKRGIENNHVTGSAGSTGSYVAGGVDLLSKPTAPATGIIPPKEDPPAAAVKPAEPIAAAPAPTPVSAPISALGGSGTSDAATGEKRKFEEGGPNGASTVGTAAIQQGEQGSPAVGGGFSTGSAEPSRADKKIKTDDGSAKPVPAPPASSQKPTAEKPTTEKPTAEKANGAQESKVKKAGKAAARKVAAAVGRTQRKTRSQGAAESTSL